MTALILTYAMIPLGMVARPVGSFFFGCVGDRYGRAKALFWTMAGMGCVSCLLALSPTYAQMGVVAPIVFCLGRVLQNFFAAGESMGGAIFLLEQSPEKRHDLLSALYNASTIGGILLASFGVWLLCHFDMVDPGWRLLYLAGCVTALFGCQLRKQMEVVPHTAPLFSNWRLPIWTHRKPLLMVVLGSGFAYANYSMALVLLNGFIPLISSLSKVEMVGMNTLLLVIDFCILPLFGWIASKMEREKMMLLAALGVVCLGLPLCLLFKGATLGMVCAIRICFVFLGVAFFAPFHAWAKHLFPQEHRYLLISLGYALGSQLLGGPTAAIALYCFKQTGIVSSIAWYWVALALLTSLLFIRKKKVVLA